MNKKDKTIKELKEVYNNTQNQDRELFIKQYHYFREIMCSKEYTLERKEKEFQNLTQAYLRCKLKEGDINMFKAIVKEFEMRKVYEIQGV